MTTVSGLPGETPAAIVAAVYADLDAFGGDAADDRTLLVMRM